MRGLLSHNHSSSSLPMSPFAGPALSRLLLNVSLSFGCADGVSAPKASVVPSATEDAPSSPSSKSANWG